METEITTAGSLEPRKRVPKKVPPEETTLSESETTVEPTDSTTPQHPEQPTEETTVPEESTTASDNNGNANGNTNNTGGSQNQSGILMPAKPVSNIEQDMIDLIKTTGKQKNYELIEYVNNVNCEYT